MPRNTNVWTTIKDSIIVVVATALPSAERAANTEDRIRRRVERQKARWAKYKTKALRCEMLAEKTVDDVRELMKRNNISGWWT